MATAGVSARNLSDAEHSAQLRRAVVASTVGSVIEAYDFLLYVLIAPLVFAKSYCRILVTVGVRRRLEGVA